MNTSHEARKRKAEFMGGKRKGWGLHRDAPLAAAEARRSGRSASASGSFFSSSASDHPLITSGHMITSNNLSIPWIGSIESAWGESSGVTSPGSARSPPQDQAEMARRKLKRILHLRSPLSSIENSLNLHRDRLVGTPAKVVPPMNVGTNEDDVLVMDAVPIQCSRVKGKQQDSPLHLPQKSAEKKWAQGSKVLQFPPPATPTTSPLLKEKTPRKEKINKTEEKRDQGSGKRQIPPPTTPTSSPLSKEKTPKKDESDKMEEKRAQRSRELHVPSPTTPTFLPLWKVTGLPNSPHTTPMTSSLFEVKTPGREETNKEEKRAQAPSAPQFPSPTKITTSPVSEVKTQKMEEAVPVNRDFIWPPTMEEEAIITKVLCGPSNKKRLPVFADICPE